MPKNKLKKKMFPSLRFFLKRLLQAWHFYPWERYQSLYEKWNLNQNTQEIEKLDYEHNS